MRLMIERTRFYREFYSWLGLPLSPPQTALNLVSFKTTIMVCTHYYSIEQSTTWRTLNLNLSKKESTECVVTVEKSGASSVPTRIMW